MCDTRLEATAFDGSSECKIRNPSHFGGSVLDVRSVRLYMMQEKSETSQEAVVDLGQKTGPLFISHPAAFPLTHIHNHIFFLHSLSLLIQSLLRD